jgi:hypothetical protein
MTFFEWLKSIFSPGPAIAPSVVPISQAPAPMQGNGGLYSIVSDWPKKEWTEVTVKALRDLAPDLLSAHPSDAGEWIKGATYNPTQLYTMILSSLAHFESSYNPDATYTEKFPDAHGNRVISRGLLQLSQESANGYGSGITDAKQLHDPETNIRTGVRIMRKLILQDGVIAGEVDGHWKGMARYWSPFRDPKKKAFIQARTKAVT